MEPTPRTAAWSAWAGWAAVPRDLLERRRLRLTVHELADVRDLADLRRLDWARLPPHQIALYTPKQIRHLIRLESALGRWPPTSAPERWRADRRPDVDTRWRVHDFIQNVRLERPLEAETGVGRGAVSGLARPARGGWEGAARGWVAGAVLLAVLVLLVRALERCLHRRLFKGQRRPSEEWPTPNVLATSHRFGNDIGSIPRLDDSDSFPSDSRDSSANDLPPPYSECANSEVRSMDDDKPIGIEEPPPPYSACYFWNPKDGIPTVHFYSRRGEEIGQSSTDTQAPNITNVNEDDDKISEVGCEVNASLENNVNQSEGMDTDDNTIREQNFETTREVCIRRRDDHIDHVVEITESGVVSQERVIAV